MSDRESLPARRAAVIQKARVGGQKIYLIMGEYEDGRLGEIFIVTSKTGTLIQSVLDNFAISVSLGLQHGVPLEEYVDAFTHTKFDPAGPVSGDDELKMASSILDYIFRHLENTYIKKQATVEEPAAYEKVAGYKSDRPGY